MACLIFFFFFNDTATTEIYTLSLHDALPIRVRRSNGFSRRRGRGSAWSGSRTSSSTRSRSEEHTSELQSRVDLVCRLLLEKKKLKLLSGISARTTRSAYHAVLVYNLSDMATT